MICSEFSSSSQNRVCEVRDTTKEQLAMENPRFESIGNGNFVKIIATFDNAGRAEPIGYAQGMIEGDGIGLLGDIHVQEQILVPGGRLNLKRISFSPRRQGLGSDLLARFETEMKSRGVTRIYGHLPNLSTEVIGCLTNWYQKNGYDVNLSPAPGEVPHGFRGKIFKLIDHI